MTTVFKSIASSNLSFGAFLLFRMAQFSTNYMILSFFSSAPVIANGPSNIASGSTSLVHDSNVLAGSGPELSLSTVGNDISSNTLHHVDTKRNPVIAVGTEDLCEQPARSSSNLSLTSTPASSSAVCFSSSDPVLEPCNDSRVPGAVGAIKREVGSHRPPGESNASNFLKNKISSDQALKYIIFFC